MGTSASIWVLADFTASLQRFVQVFATIYIVLIFAWVVLSWVDLPYSRTASVVGEFLDQVCRPYLRLFRWLPTLGPFDISPYVGILVLLVAADIVDRLIGALL
jgi:uncharacterized protein YggT (Ycf19 family)